MQTAELNLNRTEPAAASLWLIFVQHVPFLFFFACFFFVFFFYFCLNSSQLENATWSEMNREWRIKNDVASCSTVQKHAIKLLTIKIKKNFLYYLNTTSPDRRRHDHHHHRLLQSAVRLSFAPCCLCLWRQKGDRCVWLEKKNSEWGNANNSIYTFGYP